MADTKNMVVDDARRGGVLVIARPHTNAFRTHERAVSDPIVSVGFVCGSRNWTGRLSSALMRGMMAVAARRNLPAVMVPGTGDWPHGVEPVCMTQKYMRQIEMGDPPDPWWAGDETGFPWWSSEPVCMHIVIMAHEHLDAESVQIIEQACSEPNVLRVSRARSEAAG